MREILFWYDGFLHFYMRKNYLNFSNFSYAYGFQT